MTVAFEADGVEIPPGEPQRLRDTAGLLSAAAQSLDDVEAGFRATVAATDHGTWFGLAGEAFRVRVRETIEAVRIGASAMRDGAAALTQLAFALEEAQASARSAERLAEAAVGAMAATRALLTATRAEGGSPASLRIAERLERETDDLADARAMGGAAMTAAYEAARRFAAAINNATESAKAPPPPPERGVDPRENPIQFIYRQVGDVFGDQFNPRAAPDPTVGGLGSAGQSIGLVLGWAESLNEARASTATRYEPGYWAEKPGWVAGHWRRTQGGGKVWVHGYQRTAGVWVPAQRVNDLEYRAVAASKARFLKHGAGVVGAAIAGASQWAEDSSRPDLSVRERAARAVVSSVLVGGSAYLGGAAGAALLTPEAPGAGTLVGAFVGGLVGGTVGAGIGEKFEAPAFKLAGIDS